MPSKILSIEIGSKLTRVAEIDYKVKNPKIYNIFSFVTPEDAITDGKVTASDKFASLLSAELQKRVINTKKASFVLNSTRVANRIIQIPYVKENRVADFLNANASDYFPIDMNQYQLVHEINGTVTEGEEKKLELSVLAVPKELVESYRELAKACGLTLAGLDYIGHSIKKMMIKEIQEDVKATLKVEENFSILTIVENGAVKLQRTINYGVGDVIDGTIESQLFGFDISPLEAVVQLSRRTCVCSTFDRKDMNAESEEGLDREKLLTLRAFNTECFRTLIGSTSRMLDYYQSQNPESKIEKIYLVGTGSVIGGLSRLMTNELNYKVVATQLYSDISLARNAADESVHIAEFFTAIGTAFEPFSVPVNDRKAEKGAKSADGASGDRLAGISWPFAVLVSGICVIAAVALCIYAAATNSMLRIQQAQLNTQVSKLSYIEDIVATYNSAQADEQWVNQVAALTESENDNLVALIGELEEKMPSEINVLTLSATDTGLVLNIEVGSKSAAADVISQLRTFDTIHVGTVSTIAQTTEESAASTVSFSVSCNYVDLSAEAAASTASSDASEE